MLAELGHIGYFIFRGNMIQYLHRRGYFGNRIFATGGATEVLWVPAREEIVELLTKVAPTIKMCHGITTCHPKENYNKRIGREMAQKYAEVKEFKLSFINYTKDHIEMRFHEVKGDASVTLKMVDSTKSNKLRFIP